jgi:hypothetical protein
MQAYTLNVHITVSGVTQDLAYIQNAKYEYTEQNEIRAQAFHNAVHC